MKCGKKCLKTPFSFLIRNRQAKIFLFCEGKTPYICSIRTSKNKNPVINAAISGVVMGCEKNNCPSARPDLSILCLAATRKRDHKAGKDAFFCCALFSPQQIRPQTVLWRLLCSRPHPLPLLVFLQKKGSEQRAGRSFHKKSILAKPKAGFCCLYAKKQAGVWFWGYTFAPSFIFKRMWL